MQVVDQLCNEFEREVSQMTQEMGFFKAVLFFCWEMDIESQADAIVSHWWANGSILGTTSAAGYCEVPWRTCTLC